MIWDSLLIISLLLNFYSIETRVHTQLNLNLAFLPPFASQTIRSSRCFSCKAVGTGLSHSHATL